MSTVPTNFDVFPHFSSSERVDESGGYPTRDGRPMGESDLHRRVMMETIAALTRYYAGKPVYRLAGKSR